MYLEDSQLGCSPNDKGGLYQNSVDTLIQQALRYRRLKDVSSKDSLDHFHFCLRMEHVGPIQIKPFFALEKVPSLNVKGKRCSMARILPF